MKNGRNDMRKRAQLREQATTPPVPPTPDYSDGRSFDPMKPHIDGFPRVMITEVTMRNAITGEIVSVYAVDYFNCRDAAAAALLYERGKETVQMAVDADERPIPNETR